MLIAAIAIYELDVVSLCMLTTQSCPTLCDPMDYIARQAPVSMGFSRQEYWSGLPFPSPGNPPKPGIEPRSTALQADSLPPQYLGSPPKQLHLNKINK